MGNSSSDRNLLGSIEVRRLAETVLCSIGLLSLLFASVGYVTGYFKQGEQVHSANATINCKGNIFIETK